MVYDGAAVLPQTVAQYPPLQSEEIFSLDIVLATNTFFN